MRQCAAFEPESWTAGVGLVMAMVVAIFAAPAGGECVHEVPEGQLEAGRGLVGDRYWARSGTFSQKLERSNDWEITLIEGEQIDRFNDLDGRTLSPGEFRRNVVTKGVNLNNLVGQRFMVGDALLEGIRLCEPCAYLAELLGPTVTKHMAHRAGLRARILRGATIRKGDEVRISIAA